MPFGEDQPLVVEFSLLGPLDVRDGTRAITVPGRRPRALLALLLMNAPVALSSERLVEMIWGDDPPASARNALQVHVVTLRKALGRSTEILTRPSGYALEVPDDSIDVRRFERLARDGLAAAAEGRLEVAAATLRMALELWRGPALVEFLDQPWAVSASRRLEELRLTALEARFEADLAAGREGVVPELEGLLSDYPTRERLAASLMLALYRTGRQADASAVYQATSKALADELGMDPGRALQSLLKDILNQAPYLDGPVPSPSDAARTSLPTPLTSFIGRHSDVETIAGMLSQSRLVTLLGPGGIGKTRLAIETARRVGERFPHGEHFVDLAPVTDGELVAQTVRTTVGADDRSLDAPRDVVAAHLRGKQTLLIVDNCEHMVGPLAGLVHSLLERCPELRVLATSREALRVPGEAVFDVEGLPTAATDNGGGEEAELLFRQRVSDAGGRVDQASREAVRTICQQVDGIPLAIELAAARSRVMSPDEVLRMLNQGLAVLARGPRTAAARHQTLDSALDWSYGLLDDSERLLFERLSVFEGSFDLSAATGVCSDTVLVSGAVVDALAGLVDKSMISVVHEDRGPRYRMLQVVRLFGRRRLAERGAATVNRQHAHYHLALITEASRHLRTATQIEWLAALDLVFDDLRATFEYGLDNDALAVVRAVSELDAYWMHRRISEGRLWVSRALGTPVDDPVARTDALYSLTWLLWSQGDYEGARQATDQMIAIAARVRDDFRVARAHRMVALIHYSMGDMAAARRDFEQCVPELRRAGTTWELAIALNDYGLLLHESGETAEGATLVQEALELAQQTGDPFLIAMVVDSAATVDLGADPAKAERLWRSALASAANGGDAWVSTFLIDGLGRIAVAKSEPDRAIRLFAAARLMRRRGGSSPTVTAQAVIDGEVQRARAMLAPGAAEAAEQEVEAMSWAELVAYALS